MKPTRNNRNREVPPHGDPTLRQGPHTPRYRVSDVSDVSGRPETDSGVRRTAGRGSTGAPPRRRPARTVGIRREMPKDEPLSTSAKLIDRFNSWRLGLTLDAEAIVKALVLGVLLVFFVLLQTTLFTTFRPFGAVPDLLLPFVVVVGTVEKEKWGAVVALIAAFVSDAAGGTEITLLPLLYVPVAFACGILSTHSFRDSLFVSGVYTVASSALRGIVTFAVVMLSIRGIRVWDALAGHVIPEFFANIIMAALPQLLTRAVLRPFHKTRDERTGGKR